MRIGIVGHFGFGKQLLNGQTVKTQNLVKVLEADTDIALNKMDTCGWKKRPFALLRSIRQAFKECDAVVMLPAHNGVQVFAPILLYFRKKYHKKVYYDVIGGWLPALLRKKKQLAKKLKQFDGIWVETNTMKEKLNALGFYNITVIPNFKELQPLRTDALVYPAGVPYKLCTFSRVMREKGIQTAVEAVKKVNERCGFLAYTLDIYGQIDPAQIQWFADLQKNFPAGVHYCGCVDANRSVEVLCDYFALLFPTHFYTEGIPGTVIDAYAAGIPVISARWESFADVIDDGKTGIGYEFDDAHALEEILMQAVQDPKRLLDMKPDCLIKASDYSPEAARQIMAGAFSEAGLFANAKMQLKHSCRELFWSLWWNMPWCRIKRRSFEADARSRFDYEKNADISIVAANCIGGELYSVLGLQFTSPFINCSMNRTDFITMARYFSQYMDGELKHFFYNVRGEISCWLVPKTNLPPVCIAWPHDKSIHTIVSNFEKRRARIRYDRLVFLTDSKGLSDSDYEIFAGIDAYKKAIFTAQTDSRFGEYIEKIPAASVSGLQFKRLSGLFRFQEIWDFVQWFNQ